jgi:hypothetical protein
MCIRRIQNVMLPSAENQIRLTFSIFLSLLFYIEYYRTVIDSCKSVVQGQGQVWIHIIDLSYYSIVYKKYSEKK